MPSIRAGVGKIAGVHMVVDIMLIFPLWVVDRDVPEHTIDGLGHGVILVYLRIYCRFYF